MTTESGVAGVRVLSNKLAGAISLSIFFFFFLHFSFFLFLHFNCKYDESRRHAFEQALALLVLDRLSLVGISIMSSTGLKSKGKLLLCAPTG